MSTVFNTQSLCLQLQLQINITFKKSTCHVLPLWAQDHIAFDAPTLTQMERGWAGGKILETAQREFSNQWEMTSKPIKVQEREGGGGRGEGGGGGGGGGGRVEKTWEVVRFNSGKLGRNRNNSFLSYLWIEIPGAKNQAAPLRMDLTPFRTGCFNCSSAQIYQENNSLCAVAIKTLLKK